MTAEISTRKASHSKIGFLKCLFFNKDESTPSAGQAHSFRSCPQAPPSVATNGRGYQRRKEARLDYFVLPACMHHARSCSAKGADKSRRGQSNAIIARPFPQDDQGRAFF